MFLNLNPPEDYLDERYIEPDEHYHGSIYFSSELPLQLVMGFPIDFLYYWRRQIPALRTKAHFRQPLKMVAAEKGEAWFEYQLTNYFMVSSIRFCDYQSFR